MALSLIGLRDVRKGFGQHLVVNQVNLEVPKGQIMGLLGPNGAGKTTLIRLMLGMIKPDAGSVTLFDGQSPGPHLGGRIGYLPEERGLYADMRVLDVLVYLGRIRGLNKGQARAAAQHWLARFALSQWRHNKVGDLSKGMQQKVQLIGTLLHDPELIILDEPFSGLDPINAQIIQELIVELANEGRTLLLSTHRMEQAERMCHRIAIMVRGQKRAEGTLEELRSQAAKQYLHVRFGEKSHLAQSVLDNAKWVSQVDNAGASAVLVPAAKVQPEQLLAELLATGVTMTQFEVVQPSLKDIFVSAAE